MFTTRGRGQGRPSHSAYVPSLLGGRVNAWPPAGAGLPDGCVGETSGYGYGPTGASGASPVTFPGLVVLPDRQRLLVGRAAA